jgi:tetratricopeptide (TPR) repeat protein
MYCKKCIGRILRLQAEAEPDQDIKKARLAESVEWLRDAIEMFEQSPEHGPSDSDAGDSYSLLGRTYMVAGQLDSADACVRRAFDIILARASKDYMDLKILAGDMEARRGNLASAESHYSDVLALSVHDDHEKSEILARARLQRGILLERVGRIEAAKADYKEAQRMWSELDERAGAAKAE